MTQPSTNRPWFPKDGGKAAALLLSSPMFRRVYLTLFASFLLECIASPFLGLWFLSKLQQGGKPGALRDTLGRLADAILGKTNREHSETVSMAASKLKYLEFLQAAITRMASNSFLVKGWSVALGTAVLGFSVKEGNWALALIASLPAGAFWTLDAYYLALERRFRNLWTAAASSEQPAFNMAPGGPTRREWMDAARRPAIVLAHLPTISTSVFVGYHARFAIFPWALYSLRAFPPWSYWATTA